MLRVYRLAEKYICLTQRSLPPLSCSNAKKIGAQPVSLRRSRGNGVPSISQGMIFPFPRFGWGKEVFGSLWIPL